MVEQGNTVKVHYKGTLTNGEMFDTSEGREPLEFTVGENQVIPGFEDGVMGLEIGDKKTITIEAENAYGEHVAEMVTEVESSMLPPQAQVGAMLQGQNQMGQPIMGKVLEMNGDKAKIDFNHPLAGEELTFEIELVECS